jgi:heme-degrading monooxygenase HmoA
MIAVIAENFLKDGQEQAFLDISARIRPSIEAIDGFVSVERFESLSQPGKILSLSFWRDEEALLALRQNEPHRVAEGKGRAESHPLLWRPEAFGLTHQLCVSNRTDVAQRRGKRKERTYKSGIKRGMCDKPEI